MSLIRQIILIQGMAAVSNEIRTLNLNAIATPTFDLDSLSSHTLAVFAVANRELIKILQRKSDVSSSGPSTPQFRTTVPANPNYSGGSAGSKDSWTSGDSKDEHYTHTFAYQFINASFLAIQHRLGRMSWLQNRYQQLFPV